MKAFILTIVLVGALFGLWLALTVPAFAYEFSETERAVAADDQRRLHKINGSLTRNPKHSVRVRRMTGYISQFRSSIPDLRSTMLTRRGTCTKMGKPSVQKRRERGLLSVALQGKNQQSSEGV